MNVDIVVFLLLLTMNMYRIVGYEKIKHIRSKVGCMRQMNVDIGDACKFSD